MASFGPSPPRGPRKWAYSEQATRPPQKCHFVSYNGSDHDIMEKRRLASRVFGFTRHHKPYNNLSLTQPPRDCAAYASDDERHSGTVDGHLKELRCKERAKQDVIVDCLRAEREYQQQKNLIRREEDWQKDFERVEYFREKPHARVLSNKSGADYDIFTLEYRDSFAGQRLKYEDDCQKWRAGLRKLHINSKASGCGNYNILNWQKKEAPEVPAKPIAPEPPPPKSPRPRQIVPPVPGKIIPSKEESLVCTVAGTDDLQPQEPVQEVPVQEETKVRDVIVGLKHPWEHFYLEHPS